MPTITGGVKIQRVFPWLSVLRKNNKSEILSHGKKNNLSMSAKCERWQVLSVLLNTQMLNFHKSLFLWFSILKIKSEYCPTEKWKTVKRSQPTWLTVTFGDWLATTFVPCFSILKIRSEYCLTEKWKTGTFSVFQYLENKIWILSHGKMINC